jgi:oligoendopeptidase F
MFPAPGLKSPRLDAADPKSAEGSRQPHLPEWDLSDLYEGIADKRIEADLGSASAEAVAFEQKFQGNIVSIAPAALAEAIAAYQAIEERVGRLLSYAQLLFSGDSASPAIGQFYQTISERVTAISSHLVFFTLEVNRISDEALADGLRNEALAVWQPWLRDLRVFREHQLSGELEKLLHDKDITDRAWTRLFDQTMAGLRIPLGGEALTVSAALNKLSDPDRAARQAAGEAVGKAFMDRADLFSLITNTLAKDKEIIDTWRRYPAPGSYRNRSNMVEDEVVDALVSAVRASYGRLSHRYYALKARWMGLSVLEHWDRNAPLPKTEERPIDWQSAQAIVLDSYRKFSPEMAETGEQFFKRGWIDAGLRDGKSGGAFAHPTVPSVHPYILMNYHGKTRDVMTLAHELGHGVHQMLAAPLGYLRSNTPLTLAETASVFGEMLTFQSLLAAETDKEKRRVMLAGKVEDMLNTVVRQTAFYDFETRVHNERRTGEILPERLNEIWLSVQRESLGPAFHFTPEYGIFWAYIPHFIHSPFYVYAYAFGDCLVNALYSVYREGAPGFEDKYLAMLRAGGTKRHAELLAPFGLNAAGPQFWNRGLDVISGFIDELEQAV